MAKRAMFLHRTRIGKYTMKKFSINGQWRNKFFFIVIHCFSLVKAAMDVLCVCKLRKNCLTGISNGNDIEAKRNEASILRHFLYRSETNKLILKL